MGRLKSLYDPSLVSDPKSKQASDPKADPKG